MVEIRVAVTDATGVHGLAWRLAGVLDRSSVSFDEPGKVARGSRRRVGEAVDRGSLLHQVGPVPITSSP